MSSLSTAQTTVLVLSLLLPLAGLGLIFALVDFRRLSGYLKAGPVLALALAPALGWGLVWLGLRGVERPEGYRVSFAAGDWLYAALAIDGLVAAFGYAFLRKGMALWRFARSPLAEILTPTVSVGRQFLKAVLVVLAAVAVVVALARPQWGQTERPIRAVGRELMIVLDVSRSMLAEDLYPNRLERAKADIRDLVSALEKEPGFRVGLVAFAGRAAVKCPLTLDYGYFKARLEELGPHSVSRGGTMIGDAIRTAVRAFPDQTRGYKDILLITDGEDHESFPLEAAKEAKDRQIPIYTIGLGDPNEGQRIPVRDAQGRLEYLTHHGQVVWTRMQGRLLMEIASITGGAYAPARTKSIDLDRIFFEKIALKERRELEEKKQERQEDRFQIFLGAALALLLAESFVTERRKNGGPGRHG